MVLKPGHEADAKKIFDKWDLDAEVIGHTTDTGRLVLKQHGAGGVRYPGAAALQRCAEL